MSVAVKSVAKEAGQVAATVQTAKASAPNVRVRRAGGSQRPVANAMLVILMLGVLRTVVVEKSGLPGRKFWTQMAVLGFVLALITELSPKLGKALAYLVMVAAIFAQSVAILDTLGKTADAAAPGADQGAGPGMVPVALSSSQQRQTLLISTSSPVTGVPIKGPATLVPGSESFMTAPGRPRMVRPKKRYVDPYSPL